MPRPKKIAVPASGEPLMAMYAEGSENTTTTRSRRNRASTIQRTDKYANIEDSPLPYKFSSGYNSGNRIDPREAILLCQKAYTNIGIVRNIVEIMTEFSIGEIYFRGGNRLSREFFEAWWRKIGGFSLQDRLYRGYYREGQNFVYRFEAEVQQGDARRIISNFGLTTAEGETLEVPKMKLPVRYVLINPAEIMFNGGLSFYNGTYYKHLSDFELARLRKPQTDEELEVLHSLPPDIQKAIKNSRVGGVDLPLDIDKTVFMFYKKQDFEPFATPMIWPVLEDCNAKLELKRLDMAIARTQQQVILLVTTGAEPDKGGVNQANLLALQQLFQNESIGRVLVADYTTKAEFVIPDIGSILTPQKYEQLDRDINLGLNNILVGGEKFANQSVKVEVFLARLELGRKFFLETFLEPEIRRIAKSLGFKRYPIPYYDDVKLKNSDLRDKVYLRLAELGLLTPQETFTSLEKGRLPDKEGSHESQEDYKSDRDAGLYQPLIGGAKEAAAGRPEGTNAPQMTKKVAPIGTKASHFSLRKLTDNMKAAQALGNDIASVLKLKFKKKKLNEEQIEVATSIAQLIIANEEPDNWKNAISDYIKQPVDKNRERVKAIQELAATYQCDDYLASLLYISQTDKPSKD